MEGRDELPRTPTAKLTYDDFLRFPDDGLRHELIDGEHYVTPSPATVHQRAAFELVMALGAYVKTTGVGQLFFAPFDVVLSSHDVVEPDLLVVLADQADVVTTRHVRGAPALVVEILSPSTHRRDRIRKFELYARAGVREYWMVDPERRSIVVGKRTQDGVLRRAPELLAALGDTLTSPLFPGFELELEALFGDR